MSFHDISLKLTGETLRWVTAPPFELEERRRMSKGDPNNSSALNMSVHSGTHIDAPFHFVADGINIHQLPVARFTGDRKRAVSGPCVTLGGRIIIK